MASHRCLFLCTLITLSSLSLHLHRISAVAYTVTNDVAQTPGGIRFTNEIGIPYTKKTMGTVNNFIWNDLFKQNNPSDQKPVNVVNLYIEVIKGDDEAITWGNNNINVSSIHLQEYKGDLKWDFTFLLYHEMTHVFQWDGQGHAPAGLLEGIADYTALKANHYPPGRAKPGDGNRWDEGYDITARFLEYCDEIAPGFVAKLNKKMRFTYNVNYFVELTGKTVDQLWIDYRAKYGHR